MRLENMVLQEYQRNIRNVIRLYLSYLIQY
jgi:hypothetical protein